MKLAHRDIVVPIGGQSAGWHQAEHLSVLHEELLRVARVLREALEPTGTRLLSYCLMGNHWHMVVWPQEDGELSRFAEWLTLTCTQRWHAHRRSAGSGHLYQGRFKSFPVQANVHFLTVCRYVERNALRANLVLRAGQWRWSSLSRWACGTSADPNTLSPWPLRRTPIWIEYVNEPQTAVELAALRRSVNRGCPYGDETWSAAAISSLGLEITSRPQGRPRKNGS